MRTQNVFLVYAPRGPGLCCAVAYLSSGRDVYGWFTGPRQDTSLASAFFVLEDFYANAPIRYEAVAPAELQAYAEGELAAGELNVRFERLARFCTVHSTWTCYSEHFDHRVLEKLASRWPLEYRPQMERTAAEQASRHAKHARP